MVVVAMLASIVVVVVKVLVWATSIVHIVVIAVVVVVVVVVVVEVLVIDVYVLKFALPASCSVPSEAAVDLSMDVLTGVKLGLISIEVLADASANAFTLVMTALELPVSTPLEAFSR